MAFNPRNNRPDGFQVINGGIHSGIAPNLLTRQQLAWAVNVTARDSFSQTRPGWIRRLIQFKAADGSVDSTLESNFQDNLWQGAIAFEARNQLVASIGGRLFATKVTDYSTLDVSVPSDPNRSDLRRAWLVEANGFVIVQDGQDAAIIYDGAKSRRADPFGAAGVKEVPTGTVMAYANSRLWIASPNGYAFVAGDIAFGPTGTPEYGRADSILKLTENDFLNEGGAFGVPINGGRINAMAPVAQLDTAIGHGPLQVFTDRAIFSLNAPTTRTAWKDLQSPIQTVSAIHNGATSWTGVALINGDLWFRATDGIRSFMVGRRDFGSWANTPQSKELDRVLPKDNRYLLKYSSAAAFDDRLLATAKPRLNWDHGTYHQALAVLDFSPVSQIGATASPVWEGIWTGLNILQLVSGSFDGVERLFAYCLSSDDKIQLWELTRDAMFDNNGSGDIRIQSSIETGAMNWQNGFDMLALEYGELHYDRIGDRVDFTVEYRPDQEPCWRSWHDWNSCARIETCAVADPATGCAPTPDNLALQYRHRVRFPLPADDCDPVTGKPYRHGYEFQVRLSWTGAVRIKKLRLWASQVPEPAVGACEETV